MMRRLGWFMVMALLVHTGHAWAQSARSLNDTVLDTPLPAMEPAQPVPVDDLPEVMARQRALLQGERGAVLVVYESQKKLCWQKFAVNPCLNDARRQRRQALHPLKEQELSLNAQERLWRTEQRNLRLQNKAPEPKDPS
jgi:hypothetical protein